MTADDIFEFLGRALAFGLSTTGIFLLVCKKIIDTWIEKKFEARQKQYEHEHSLELLQLRAKIDTTIQGALRLQEREFNVLPEAWSKASEAFGRVLWLTGSVQSHGSIRGLSVTELEEFFASSQLRESQKQVLRDAPDKDRDRLWWDMDMQQRYRRVRDELAEADTFVKVNGVFIPSEILENLKSLIELCWECVISYETGSSTSPKDYAMIRSGWAKLNTQGSLLHKEIESDVRARLGNHSKMVESTTA